MMMRITSLLVALSASVSGCTSSSPVESSTEIIVRQENKVLFLQSLRAVERQRLRNFIASASRGRSDAVHLFISGPPWLGAQIASQVMEMGVDGYNIRLFEQHHRSAARIEAIVYDSLPPDCPPFSGPLANDSSFDRTLGCSTRRNLAVMVNDPRDLIDNNAVRPSLGDRAAIPVAKYRTFETGKTSSAEQGK
ncbi:MULTISPECIES: CpaD family pilus assembly lipoprotein [Mesorhizobium]|uniref:CpaD family pilus assembly lipoprotein n=6 Tax=Mesorhizobium TaxID=68287 RepID=A0ABU5ABA1_9HYPH|nr:MULTISPECIES: CpaD family pilus assembly lipoprotein [Mesorhizobium]MDX8437725.1 CpaD family pilus assembly lipoprotein [Mesorhizobium abyssinicae]MDX8443986.1 CpaD family pilus assembly lipoprotein [Mesorhizobium sp. VK3C]MDX8456413.1 CpaD family pilus assembly lipoprotein [Mesorhizobium sp. VK9D]MDX8461289.1 CpaD family pilus assembly lipoprotein [Mesorhizobium sp. VK2D]MDX8469905.1 CpaD family pilus assembly lipoprotein [Mesorhizobium sp. VK23B]